MDFHNFTEELESAQNRLETLQKSVVLINNQPPEVIATVVSELSVALEELHVAAEELQQQNQELAIAREQLEVERSRYWELFEQAPDGYLVTDTRGKIQEANRAAAGLLNADPRFMRGKPLTVFVAQSHRQIFRRQLHALQENPAVRDWEVWLQPRNKQGFLSSISICAMLDSQGELTGFRWSIRDLTDRQKLEDFRIQLETQTKVSQFKSRIIRTLSHEFRTPLNLIYLSCQMLERYYEGIARDKTTPLFDKIRLGIRNMTSLLEDALLFDKGERQQLEFKPAQLDLNEFCAHVIREQLFLHSRSDRPIDFVPCNECQSVCLDAKLLKHIVENLLCNALKYTPSERFIYFTLNCNKNNVMLTVKDEGRGIPEDDLPHVFEPFHRAANVGGIGGSGLGLAIVQKCVEAHGGTMEVESHLNEGSTFTVTLSIARF